MEPKVLLPHSQESTTRLYSEPDKFSPCPPAYLLKIHFNIILPPTPGSSKLSLSLRFTHQNPVRTTLVSHACHMYSQSHFFLFHYSKNIWQGLQVIKLLST
jgi:hypothetical protein